ncbi:helicase-primase subunit [Aotine betaherpesvirus 1]|uniref:Helicase-primase subunit n=1 Tax=Aotine betaherpesvirus 1 TaxID=50290 RepID=G8XUG6_9BETA|nr:helicase-primase subunit [Aotine betaherpesvirus 1]AEV80796.1 helicase-primase subunit [Aotine betaherpesvirus 1]
METQSLQGLLGASCHLGLYGVVDGVPVMRCLFLELRASAEPQLRSLLLQGERLRDPEARELARSTYTSLAAGATDADERRAALGRRSALMAQTLASSAVARVLARLFVPVRVWLDSQAVEVVAAESVPSAQHRRRLEEALSLYHVAKMVVIGSYPTERDYATTSSAAKNAVADDPRATATEYVTHANKKLKRGYYASEMAMSFRVGSRKRVLEQSQDAHDALACLKDLFQVRDVRFLRSQLRLVTPRGFLAVAVTDEQCFVLLRTAWRWIYDVLIGAFSGIRPLFDYLGPDLYDQGGPRSVFFPGFPGLLVYAVTGLSTLLRETAFDAVGEAVSLCGLPDVVGPAGKLPVRLRSERPARITPEELIVFYGNVDGRPLLRTNGTSFVVRSRDDLECSVHLRPGAALHRFTLHGLVEAVMARCVREEDFDAALPYTHRVSREEVCLRFLENLRHRAMETFIYVQGLLGYISQHLTSACASAGLEWVMVKNHREIYAYDNEAAPVAAVHAELCVRTVLQCYWKKLFGDAAADEPRCVKTDTLPGVLVLLQDEPRPRIVGAFETPSRDQTWLDVVGRVLARVPRLTPSSAVSELRDLYRDLLFQFVSHRNEVSFWVTTCYPGDVVRAHAGVIDCAPFPGVWSEQGEVLVQSRDAALEADVGYGRYLRRAFAILSVCVLLHLERQQGAAAVSPAKGQLGSEDDDEAASPKGSPRLSEDVVGRVENTVLSNGLRFFQLNN